MSIIIGIDHGYYAIKTAHCSFPAGLTSYGEHEPYTRQGLLEFGGCFFVCGTGRQPIQRDKTVNDNYYLLTLAAIAMEIRQRGLPPECSVRIAAGLPLTSFGRDKPKFRDYLLRSNQPVNYKFEGVEYSITIEEVAIFPQGYAALMTETGLLQDEPSMLLMDLGGWTVDLMRIDNAIPVADTAHSLELGMIRCVDDIREQVRRETGLSLTDAQIENMLAGQPCTVSDTVRDIVNKQGRKYTEHLKHGKFAFPYGRIIGYRKGADGKPEIIPEQAEVIRLIFNSYLQGDSLQSIKTKLETAGALTARGNTEWSAQSIQRILQNEKYCGDVLLQKTFTEDVLTGVHKKNTGQLPQYYIENYHEGIVSKQIFREVQAEIARRNSKSAANQRKRRRGRYNSKYALTERLVCGDCGSPYKRVTWNIHGRKQIVWRCVNRIEYGTKFCGSSPSIPEEKLHRAILKAVQDLAANFTDEVAAQINGILHSIQTGESIKPNLQEQLEQTQQEFDRLLEMSLDFDEDTPFLDNRLKKLNNKIKSLKKAIEESAARQEKARQPEMLLSAKDLQILEYDDALTARIIEKITVRSRNEIEIRFTGDYKKTVTLR